MNPGLANFIFGVVVGFYIADTLFQVRLVNLLSPKKKKDEKNRMGK